MSGRSEVLAVARLELGEVLRSRWLVLCLGIYGLLAGIFVLVGMRDSSVMGFSGMGRVLFGFCHALVILLPLLGLGATAQVINRARDDGTLELLFSHPIRRGRYFAAVTLVRYLALTLPLLLLMPAMALWGRVAFGHYIPWSFLGRALATSAVLLWVSVAVGLLVSTYVRNQAKALMLLLLVWAAGVALLDFALVGMMLEWRMPPQVVFTVAAINPVQAARMGLLAAADSDLATLGPVGFYLANRIGSTALSVLGIAWPALLGISAWLLACRGFKKGDLV